MRQLVPLACLLVMVRCFWTGDSPTMTIAGLILLTNLRLNAIEYHL
jgi:hypothetical protein